MVTIHPKKKKIELLISKILSHKNKSICAQEFKDYRVFLNVGSI